MAEQNVNPGPIDTNPTAVAGEVVSPAAPSTSGGAPAGGGARPPTPSAGPSATPERAVDLNDTLEWAPGEAASLKELIEAKKQFEKVKASGYDTYTRAMAGDKVAIKEWLDKITGGTTPVGNQPPQNQPIDQPPQQPQAQFPPGYQEMVEFVNQQRAAQVRSNLEAALKQPAYNALNRRPDATELVISKLNELHARKIALTPQVVNGVMAHLNGIEAKYQESLLEPYKKQIGELGVSDPFRGGPPQNPNEPPPNHNDPKRKNWLANAFRAAVASEMAGQQVGQESIV